MTKRISKRMNAVLAALLALVFAVSTCVVGFAKESSQSVRPHMYMVQIIQGDADPTSVTGLYAIVPQEGQETNPRPVDSSGKTVDGPFYLTGNEYKDFWFTFTEPGVYEYVGGKLKADQKDGAITKDSFEEGTYTQPLTHVFGFKVERNADGTLTAIPYTCEDNQATLLKDGQGLVIWNYVTANKPAEPTTEGCTCKDQKKCDCENGGCKCGDKSGCNCNNNNNNNNSNNNSQNQNQSQEQNQNSNNENNNNNSNGGNSNNNSNSNQNGDINIVINNGGDNNGGNGGKQNDPAKPDDGKKDDGKKDDKDSSSTSSSTSTTTKPSTTVKPVTDSNGVPVTNSNGQVKTTIIYNNNKNVNANANANSNGTTKKGGTANTGDEQHLVLWVAVLGVAAAGLLIILLIKRRNRDDDEQDF